MNLNLLAQNQDLHFQRLSLEQGLSQSNVYCIFQDSKGWMWFGTEDGLNKFDGYQFTYFTRNPLDTNSISSNTIFSIDEDPQGNLWIGTAEGLNKFNPKTEKFTQFLHNPLNSNSLSNNLVNVVYFDKSNNLWVGTADGLNEIIETKENSYRFVHHKNDLENENSISNNEIFAIQEDQFGTLWIGTASGLNQLLLDDSERSLDQPAHFQLYQIEADKPETSSKDWFVAAIYEDNAGILWVGDQNGLNRIALKNAKGIRENEAIPAYTYFSDFKNKSQNISDNFVNALWEDKTGKLWIGTQDGIWIFDLESETFIQFQNEINDANSLSNNTVLSIFEDHSGIIWIGTFGGGINKFDKESNKFKHFKHLENLTLNSSTTCFFEKDSVLWIGTYGGGLFRFDRKNNQARNFIHQPNNPNSLSDDWVSCIYEDENEMLWIGTYGKGKLNILNPETEKFIPPENYFSSDFSQSLNKINASNENRIRSIFKDSKGNVWLGGFLINPSTTLRTSNEELRINNEKLRNKNEELLMNNDELGIKNSFDFDNKRKKINDYLTEINSDLGMVLEDAWGNIWIATDSEGLICFNPENQKIFTFKHEAKNLYSLSNNRVNVIHQSKNKDLWIGTSSGLNRLKINNSEDFSDIKFSIFTNQDGLPSDVIYGILEDDSANLWISTTNGISRFNPEKNTFKNYDLSDGLQSKEFLYQSFYKSQNGEFFFGGINGFNVFYPNKIQNNPNATPVVFTDFQIFNRSISISEKTQNNSDTFYLNQHISFTKELNLNYKQSSFSLEFAGLNYSISQKNQYQYRLENYEKNWIDAQNRRFVTYSNLPSGKYIFKVRASNNDGVWDENFSAININISPAPWKTWWAYLIYVFLILGLLGLIFWFLLYRERLNNQIKLEQIEREKIQEIDQVKSRFFANISHEFRTPLTLILSPLKQLQNKNFRGDIQNQYNLMSRNAEKLLQLINQILDLTKLESGKMKLQASIGNLPNFLKRLTDAFQNLAAEKEIDLTFQNSPPSGGLGGEFYFDPEKLEQILYNLISNAIKHTPKKGKISLILKENKKHFEILVKDSGAGIPKNLQDKIFNRFYQVQDSRVESQSGTGVGLALVIELVELHHGKISLESEIGKGTCFKLEFLKGKKHLAFDEIVESNPEIEIKNYEKTENLNSSTENKNAIQKEEKAEILLVEDNLDVRTYLKENLENKYKIFEAENGKIGLKKAIEKIPDLVISDYMMPEMNGIEFSKQLKTNELTSHIPIVMLTARADTTSKLKGLKTGADDYLTKPYEVQELQIRVENLIEQRKKLKAKFSQDFSFNPKAIEVNSMDEQFLKRLMKILETHYKNPEFNVENLANEMGLSRMQLHRKIKGISQQTASEFLRHFRLKQAAQLLAQNHATVSEIAFLSGFNNLSYFTKSFKELFGVLPSEFEKA